MFPRAIETLILKTIERYRALTLIGPRQSGKTFLTRYRLFKDYNYISLENPDTRQRALLDPRGFLATLSGGTILDEVQRTPDLLSYLQEILDDPHDDRKFILTGSNSLLMSSKIAQSLAGRTRILRILPLSFDEIPEGAKSLTVDDLMFRGSYPRLYNEPLEASEWYGDYFQTYVEKDIRDLLQIENLVTFDRFVRVSASRVGQLVNFSSMAGEIGLSQPTMVRWMSVLEASFIVFTLAPHFKNFSKRLIKSPKIYFYDTGLLCWLLGIRNPHQLQNHPLRGQIFENLMISEALKRFSQVGRDAPLYFWRDQHGHEIDLVIDRSTFLECIEMKSSQTFHPDFINQIRWLNELQDHNGGTVLYTGSENFKYQDIEVRKWNDWALNVLGD
ncbi:MAG: ATP-binding protein [Pseudobdellovibrionaceae bacterium]|nr:ATP-binding protein [Pseudobdellovibrionaceae bacterium]